MARKPTIRYPWELYSEAIRWMAIDDDGRVYAYTSEPSPRNEDGQFEGLHFAEGDFVEVGVPYAHWLLLHCQERDIPWHETKRRRQRRRKEQRP